MAGATTADLEQQDAQRLERYRRATHRSYMFAVAGYLAPTIGGLWNSYDKGDIGVPVAVAALAGLGLLTWAYLRLVRAGLAGGATRREIGLSGAVAALLGLMLFTSPLWCVVPVFWVSAVALTPVGRRELAALCLGAGTYCALITTFAPGHDDRNMTWYQAFPVMLAIFTGASAFAAYINRYQRRMWDLHQEAYAGRDALARLAVTEERLRFSRDLHDLLGHSLSLIAVKSELAMRLADTDPSRAGAEMADVRRAARDALREVRAAVRGYRAVELDAELAGVRAVLEAAGVRCEIGDPPGGLAPEVRSVLAWVIREGATNVIKHSEARRCSLALTVYGESVMLEMRNDGVRETAGGAGSGLTGLAERVSVLGGQITADRHGRDGFLLRAVVPLPSAPAPVLAAGRGA